MAERVITVRLFAAAAQAAGAQEVDLRLPEGTGTVGEVVAELPTLLRGQAETGAHGGDHPGAGRARSRPGGAERGSPPSLEKVCARSSFLLNERRARPETPVGPGDVLDVLPPFAGG